MDISQSSTLLMKCVILIRTRIMLYILQFIIILPTWCIDTKGQFIPKDRLHSQHLTVTAELNLGVVTNHLIFQQDEHLHRALRRTQCSSVVNGSCIFWGEKSLTADKMCLTPQRTLHGTTTMLDLTLWAPVDCIFSSFCSDTDDLLVVVFTFAAVADAPLKSRTENLMPIYVLVMSTNVC